MNSDGDGCLGALSISKPLGVDFLAIDVEIANPALSSICQVGIASFRNGHLLGSWESLVNPEDYFHPINVSIHGIGEDDVRQSPTWSQVYPYLYVLFENCIVVSHTAFDRAAVLRACEKNALAFPASRWLDSARVVRRAWPMFSRSGYGLANVAYHFDIQYRAHNALEDARCAGEIVLRAIAETGVSTEEWLERANQPIHPPEKPPVVRVGDPDGPLYGEVLVFTGALSILRREASDAASAAGCEVDAGVTKRTTVLVVGDEDVRKLAGHEKSSKHRKVEDLIAKGQKIRILGESDFQRIVSLRSE